MKIENNDRNFELKNITYLNFDNLKLVIFTTLESSISQNRACIMYKIDAGSDCNLMPFKLFKILFPKATLSAMKDNSVRAKSYNLSDIKQLGMCTVRLRHKDRSVIYKFFVSPRNNPVLL